MNEVTKAISIATAVKHNFFIDDAGVPLYPALTKTTMKRDWTGSEQQWADYLAACSRLAAKTPGDAEGFMLMLKRYARNLLHALFSSQSPIYQQMYGIVRALCYYSPNTRAKISHKVK